MFDRNSDVSRIRSPWDACESWSADINPWEQDWWCQRPLCVCLGVSLLQHAHTHTQTSHLHMQRHVRNKAAALSRMHAHICALERKHTSDTQIFLAHPPPLEIQATDMTRNDQRRSQDRRDITAETANHIPTWAGFYSAHKNKISDRDLKSNRRGGFIYTAWFSAL